MTGRTHKCVIRWEMNTILLLLIIRLSWRSSAAEKPTGYETTFEPWLILFDIISPSKYSPRHPDVALGRLDASQVDFVLCNQWWPADIAVLPFPLISTAHSSLFSCYEPPHQCWGNIMKFKTFIGEQILIKNYTFLWHDIAKSWKLEYSMSLPWRL